MNTRNGSASYGTTLARRRAARDDRARQVVVCSELSLTDPRWLDFVQLADDATVFHHPVWSQLLADCYGYRAFVIAALDTQEQVAGGVPVLEINSWLTGRRWVSLAFSDHCAPLCLTPGAQQMLIREMLDRAEESGVQKLEIRSPIGSAEGFVQSADNVLHLMPLEGDVDRVISRVHRMHLRNVSTAKKRGVELQRGESMEMVKVFYDLHLEARRRQGVPIQPWRFFRLLQQRLLSTGMGFVLLALVDGEYAAGAVFLHQRQHMVYKFGASSGAGRDARANNLIFHDAIRWGCQQGFTMLDMGRTSPDNAGLRSFKSRWGAEEYPLTYSRYWPDATGRREHGKGCFARTAISKSPRLVCRVAGELLYGHFG